MTYRHSFRPGLTVTLLGLLLTFGPLPSQAAGLLREVWTGIGGSSVIDLTSSPNYPDHPDQTNLVTGLFESPTDVLESYGQRMHGYVVPPLSGQYTFWIASDDGGELWLSTDDTQANKKLIAWVSGWTSPRQWGWEGNQQSAPVTLQAGRFYYIAALMKEGGGGDNLAVRWLRPDGVDEAPMPATYLQPWGVVLEPPRISIQPEATTAVEGTFATFQVQLASVGPAAYQWYRNSFPISYGTNRVLSFGPVSMADQQASFSVAITNNLGGTASSSAKLTVLADTVPPTLVSAQNYGNAVLQVGFSELLDPSTASTPANYSLSGGLTVVSITLAADGRGVQLVTSAMTFGTTYTLTVNNVKDLAAVPNVIATDAKISFLASEYAPLDVGLPGLAGGSMMVPGGFDVRGAGTTTTNLTADQLQFSYREVTGDFDWQVRVAHLDTTDAFAQAGLMVRDALGANARFAGAFVSSAQLGCFFSARNSAGGSSISQQSNPILPANYPQAWLRLRRSGTVLTGFGSLDGNSWVPLGSNAFSSLPNKLYFGMAVCSQDPSQLATAQFRDLTPTVKTTTTTFTPTTEPLGPSSRRTGIVISEIMYHPAPRNDARNLEFIELYNAKSVVEDLGGWQLHGDVEFTFPPDFTLPAGAFVVVAANPADLQAQYGITQVLGPYVGALSNGGGSLQLRNASGAVRLSLAFGDSLRWPRSADGAGHSLVLARPSYGEEDPRAWAASELIGGSPGQVETLYPTPLRNVLINELLVHTDLPQVDGLELYNHANTDVDVSGCYLTDDPSTNKFRIPAGTVIPRRGFLAYDANQLGFHLNAGGETIYLLDPEAKRVLDAVLYEPQSNGIAYGRYPDGAPTFRRLTSPTLGAANTPSRMDDIVINEIMYAPISGDKDDEFIELYNRSSQSVDLSGWRFIHGVSLTLPNQTVLAPGGYLVVARNAARLLGNYPNLAASQVIGNYTGSLGNGGDLISLAKLEDLIGTNHLGELVTNLVWAPQAEARFGSGGRWGKYSDGGGSSLELIDPRADPWQPSNWADSNEAGKAAWTTVSATGVLDQGNTAFQADRLYILMQGTGECLLDDVEVFKSGSTNRLTNPGFENAANNWTLAGNHSRSAVESPGASGSNCLHLRGDEDGDTGVNSIRTVISPALVSGETATIRAKVRWVAGWPEVLFRLHGNFLELPARLPVPKNLGTPGLPNSRLINNAGPAIYDVTHAPALPRSGQSVTVTCRVSDPDGLGTVSLIYRQDPDLTPRTLVMRDDGLGADVTASDGVYSAALPGQSSGTLLAFRVQATDRALTPVTALFPAGAPAQECLVRWDEPIPLGNIPHHHLWATAATFNARGASIALDNTYRDATLVYGDYRVVYNVGFRDKGSPWHGGSGDIVVTTPADNMVHGVRDRVYGSTGNGGSESTGIRSQLSGWFGDKLGIPFLHSSYIKFYINGGLFREVVEDLEVPNPYFAKSWFPDTGAGDFFKIAMWFEFDDGNLSFNNPVHATIEPFKSQGAYKMARYRWNFKRHPYDGTANNFTNIFDLVTAANDTSGNFIPNLMNIADIEQWMRVFAYDHMMGNWDSFGYSVGQNMYIFKQPGQRWVLIPWDIDFTWGAGDGATSGLWGSGAEPVINRFYGEPTFQRMVWRACLDAARGPLLPENYSPVIDARRKSLVQNGLASLQDPKPIKDWIDQRRNYILSQAASINPANLTITTGNGNAVTSTAPTMTLTGQAPFDVASIAVNGDPLVPTWTSATTYTVKVPLTLATNLITLTGLNRLGQPVPGAVATIQVIYRGAIPQPKGNVVINEVHYHPFESKASFIELYNRSTQTPFNLSGFRLDGAGYTFPDGSWIQPGGYLLLVSDRAGFANAYGQTIPVFDQFPGTLDNGGEHLALVQPQANPADDILISDVRFDQKLPWPANADGLGSSLQLVDAAQDGYRVANWAVAATNSTDRVTPGRANSVRQTLSTFPALWINEVLPNNISGLSDNAGEKDPWLEIYNAGTNSLDLTTYYLTDSYTNLTQWSFPAGTVLGPNQFLLIWADGQTAQSAPGIPHTNFRLNATNGSVALVRIQGSPLTPAVLDYVDYAKLAPDRSFGSYPDGEPRKRRLFYYTTASATNNAAYPALQLTINEFMAGNTNTLADSADGKFKDWFEIFNGGSAAVDLTSYTITDHLTNATKFTIPAGYVVPAGGYLLVWADSKPSLNQPTNADLHANFKLSKTAGQIGLFSPDGRLLDSFDYLAQIDGISMGRFPDGAELPLFSMASPTPRSANILSGGNLPPQVTAVGSRTNTEQTLIEFQVQASDPDAGQTLTYTLSAEAPAGATLDPVTGLFTWTPTEEQGPGYYAFSIRVTDNGAPARTVVSPVYLTVTEANRPPTLTVPEQLAVDEGSPLHFSALSTDADVPANAIRFSLPNGAPAGATLDPVSGAFHWTPSEAQGPAEYDLTIRASDDASPAAWTERTVHISVREVDNAPVFEAVPALSAVELSPFTYTVHATDQDNPPSSLIYSFDTAPAGATIDPSTGQINWTPTEAQGPGQGVFIVRASEESAAHPSTAITFGVAVAEQNQPPQLAPLPGLQTVEGETVKFKVLATDADLPAQTLTYELLPGAPAEASIHPLTGEFRWKVGADVGAISTSISIRVTDSGPGSLMATQTFSARIFAQWHAVISEVMYRPAAANAEYIELQNNSSRTPADLGGIQLRGSNLVYTFPANTVLAPGKFITLAKNPGAYTSAYPGAAAPAGTYSGALGTSGDTLRLVRPGPTPAEDQELWRFTYAAQSPWPLPAAESGASLQVIDATQDPNRVGNWMAVPTNGLPTSPQWQFVSATGTYTGANPLLYIYLASAGDVYLDDLQLVVGNNAATGQNLLQNGDFESSLSANWNLTGNTAGSSNSPSYHRSGAQSLHLLSAAGGSTQGDSIWQQVNAMQSGTTYTLSYWYLPKTNGGTLTIRFSGSWVRTDPNLQFTPPPPIRFTPGSTNNVQAILAEFPTLRLNEAVCRNLTGLTDLSGAHEPWIELINTGDEEVSLDGLFLSDSYSALNRWSFPPGFVLSAGGYLVLVADGEAAQTSSDEWHTNFRLPSSIGTAWQIALARAQGSSLAVVDYLAGTVPSDDIAMGRLPDGDPSSSTPLSSPSPGRSNAQIQPPTLGSIQFTVSGQPILQWPSQPGRRYQVETKDDLNETSWVVRQTFNASGETASFTDTAALSAGQRYYRIIALP